MHTTTLATTLGAAALAALVSVPAATAQDTEQLGRAEVNDTDGNMVGTVTLNGTASGTMLIVVALEGLPEGTHAIHIHETGDCSAPDFSSAGGHLAGDAEHGINAQNGPHPGDMPNVTVGSQGNVNVEVFNDLLTQEMVFDDDGSALIVHTGTDDYVSQPSGDAGDRLACGVIESQDQAAQD